MTAPGQLDEVIIIGRVDARRALRKAYDRLNERLSFQAYQGLVMAALIDEVPF